MFNRPVIVKNKTDMMTTEYSLPTKIIGVIFGYRMQEEIYTALRDHGRWENKFWVVTWNGKGGVNGAS